MLKIHFQEVRHRFIKSSRTSDLKIFFKNSDAGGSSGGTYSKRRCIWEGTFFEFISLSTFLNIDVIHHIPITRNHSHSILLTQQEFCDVTNCIRSFRSSLARLTSVVTWKREIHGLNFYLIIYKITRNVEVFYNHLMSTTLDSASSGIGLWIFGSYK